MSGFFFPGMGGFSGMGGMPGMGGMGGQPESSEGESTDNTRFYKLLGVDKKASTQQIKKAYRKLAQKLHPDKHPNQKEEYEAKFQDIQQAHEVLTDPSKRKLYDRYGEAGLRGGGGGGAGMSDIFDMFFSGQGHGHGHGHSHGRKQRRRKAPAIRSFVDVTLRDLYLGSTKEVEFERMQICKDCTGKGGRRLLECSTCHGSGRQVVVQRMGYMTMQTQRECTQCKGEGSVIPDKDRCKRCKGKGFKKENKVVSFDIPRGSKHADKVVLHALGHEVPDAANGDLVIVLRCKKHAIFNRVGADLAMTYKISLLQALCGYDIVIPHLSGFKLRLKSKPGEIVQHGQLKAIYTKGMPQKGSNVYGHLYVKFEVVFPQTGELNQKSLDMLATLLPKGDDEEDEEEEEVEPEPEPENKEVDDDEGLEENVEDYELHEEAEDVDGEPTVTPASSRSAYDEDEEQEAGGCRQM